MEMTAKEKEYNDVLIQHGKRKIQRFLDNHKNSFKDRLLVYLATPKTFYDSLGCIPTFTDFAMKHGPVEWGTDFPFLLRDQTVNLVKFCTYAIRGNLTYFPGEWSQEMINDFVTSCVNNGYHEFDYYW